MSDAITCGSCLARTWLLTRLSGHLDNVRARLSETLALSNEELIAALGGRGRAAITGELEQFDPEAARRRARSLGVEQLCRCDPAYPARLAELPNPPAVVHVVGGLRRFLHLAAERSIAIVGARKASPYGIETTSGLARGLAAAGVPIVSGMAFGIDSAAHGAVLEQGGVTFAVLPAGLDRPYPPAKRRLARRISETGVLVSELSPDTAVRRWMFPARNRIIAALATMTIVVEAPERSGALVTAALARGLGRRVGAVPGRVSSRLAAGPHGLIASGATLVTKPEDVLDAVFGLGAGAAARRSQRAAIPPELETVLGAIRDGADTPASLARAGFGIDAALAAIGELELTGLIRRGPGGSLTPTV